MSQYECGLMFMAGALQDYFANGASPSAAATTIREAAPHGAFPCRDGEWVALSCWSDAEFAALAGRIGDPGWRRIPTLPTAAARRGNRHDARSCDLRLDPRTQRRGRGAEALQAVGVARLSGRDAWPDCSPIRNSPRANFGACAAIAEIGDQAYCFPGFDLEEVPGEIVGPAPCLGADNDYVFRELLGVPDAEFEAYRERGVFG